MNAELERVYGAAATDPTFEAVLAGCRVRAAGDDPSLAELIEADGRWRLRKGRTVTLERYAAAVPDLHGRADVLDAALEVTLRALSGSARISAEAARVLSTRYPALRQAIIEAAALNAALWSTTGFHERASPRPALPLPCDFGAPLDTGERRYVLRELLGQGSFGQVYRAEDRQLSEMGHIAVVALKILAVAEHSEHDRYRMIDEATKARRIGHPNVVQVLDRGVSDSGEDFIVYEYVGGGDLGRLAAQEQPMPPRRAADLVAQIARGVHAAHAAGVIHCDLKPSNVMLTADGRPKVADFGIAVRMGEDRGTALNGFDNVRGPVGNIAFISPEQFRNEDAAFSVPSDVYALGGILFHLLTGKLPSGESREEIARAHQTTDSDRAKPSPRTLEAAVDRDLDAICQRALSAGPNARQPSAAALADDLERWLRREPIAWRSPSPARRVRLWAARKPALAAAAAAIVALTIAGAIVAAYFARQADRKAAEAYEKSVQAQLAELRLEKQQAIKDLQARFRALVTTTLTDVGGDRRFLTDVLMQVWVFEYIYGPRALGDPSTAREMWASRVTAVRGMLDSMRQRGDDHTLEFLLWEQALAFWLVSDHDHAEAIGLIEHARAQWARMLKADDPWLHGLESLHMCAEVNRLCDVNGQVENDGARRASLLALESDLERAISRLAINYPRSPLHYLTLNRLADLNDAAALNQPAKAARLRGEIEALIDATLGSERGVAQASRETQAQVQQREQQATQPQGAP